MDHNNKIVHDNRFVLIFKSLIGVIGALGLISGAVMYYLENSFKSHPRQPQVEYGYTVPYSFKAITFYITAAESLWIRVIYITFFTCIPLALLLSVYYNKKMGIPNNRLTKNEKLMRELESDK